MTPTYSGRLQTRALLLGTVGVVWLGLVAPVLPGLEGAPLADRYAAGVVALALTALAGVVWELLYHGLQQFRWDKDWPTLFGLLVAVPEGVLVRSVMTSDLVMAPSVPAGAFWLLFLSTWLLVWLVANGPLRVVSLRWRFRGGRLW